jgi:hypothetical protein
LARVPNKNKIVITEELVGLQRDMQLVGTQGGAPIELILLVQVGHVGN